MNVRAEDAGKGGQQLGRVHGEGFGKCWGEFRVLPALPPAPCMAPGEAFHLPGLQLPHNSDWGWGLPSVLLWGGDGKCRHDARRALVVHRAAPNTTRSPLVTQDITSRGPSNAVAMKLFHMSVPQVFLTPCSDPTTHTTSIPLRFTQASCEQTDGLLTHIKNIHQKKNALPEKNNPSRYLWVLSSWKPPLCRLPSACPGAPRSAS